ncbi:MAG TPA: M2 family metallopeptidase [Bacteroidales bacterium]|nr:M2 family metallopeptidase [Bacteroidales bacterium]
MKRVSLFLMLLGSLSLMYQCSSNDKKEANMNAEADSLIKTFEAKVKPLFKEMSLAYWNASITGNEADYQKSLDAEMAVNKILADTAFFAQIKKVRDGKQITDTLIQRQIEMIYASMVTKQVDTNLTKQISELQNKIEQKFSTFRATIDGKKYTDNEIEEILHSSTDSKKLEKAWVSVKELGPVVAEDIKNLAKLRNQVAKSLGYNNYHEMKLTLDEQNPKDIENLFDELDNLTRDAFAKLKSDMDEKLAARCNVKKEELMPWHYQNRFFQEAPAIYNVDLDGYYKDKDVVKLTKDYYESIGMDISDILSRSDLFEKEGKNQHAYCTDIDNEGDIRILCNVKPNNQWMGTMLHEFGHGVYDKYIDMKVPYILREPAHTFTTEAIAMLMGRLSTNGAWMNAMGIIDEKEAEKVKTEGFKMLRLEQLVFSRWAQVMYRFEKGLYENPDQDLNKLWWDLVEKYQMMKRPEGRNMPDWATKTHIATSPCYYHNYLLGELLASQLNAYIVKNILKTDNYQTPNYVGNKEVGKYLIEKVFKPGRIYYWNDMIEKATGEKLTAKYYAAQFVN